MRRSVVLALIGAVPFVATTCAHAVHGASIGPALGHGEVLGRIASHSGTADSTADDAVWLDVTVAAADYEARTTVIW